MSEQKQELSRLYVFEGCSKKPRGESNFCILHGGERRCQTPGCVRFAHGSTNLCVGHYLDGLANHDADRPEKNAVSG